MQKKVTFKQVQKFVVTDEELGKGAFGTVFRGFIRENKSKIVAVKVIAMDKARSDQLFLKFIKREIQILKKLDNPNIVKLMHVTRTANNLYLFLEFCRDGDLVQLLKSRGGRLSEHEALVFFRQICDGFRELYELNIIHRDIKPANILIHQNRAKISDFGFAKVIEDMDKPAVMTNLGTPLYSAPQILGCEKFSSKCDVWSLGVMLFEMLYGKTPFTAKSPAQLLKNIRSQPLQFPPQPRRSVQVKTLLKKMLAVEEEDRIGWQQVFQDPLLVDESETLTKQISSIMLSQSDSLLKSKALNDLYIEKHKVIGIDKGQRTLKAFVSKSEKKEASAAPVMEGSEDDFDKVIQRQNIIEQHARIASLVDKFVVFRRNLAIFLNVATTDFFANFKAGKLAIPQWLFYVGLFALQKQQNLIFEELLAYLDCKCEAVFSLFQWKVYSKSQECQLSRQAIVSDMKFIVPYFKQVKAKTKVFLQNQCFGLSAQCSAFLARFKKEDINSESRAPTSKQALRLILREILPELGKMDRACLMNVRFIQISEHYEKVFTWNGKQFDFSKFYEELEEMNKEQLIAMIKEQ